MLKKEPTTKLSKHSPIIIVFCLIAVLSTGVITLINLDWLKKDNESITSTIPRKNATTTEMAASLPVTLRIPAIALSSGFVEPLGLTDRNEIEVPASYDRVGWYGFGPTPGEIGPAVILGHVDSKAGPAIFWSLGKLEKGDTIFIDRTDGTTVEFQVTELRRVAQSHFPTLEVYGDIDFAGLRLITCSGLYVRGEQRYSHNLIVFAKAV